MAVSWLVERGQRGRWAPLACAAASAAASRSRCSSSRTARRPAFSATRISKPERSRGFDVGFEQRFAGDRAAIELTYFANHFDDLISLGPFDPVTFNAQYENIGETRASGLELAGTAFVDWRVSLRRRLHVARFESRSQHQQQPDLRARTGSCTGGRVTPARCRRRTRATASSVALGGVFVGSRVDTDFNFPSITSNEGYATWNASGEVRFARRTAGFVTIDNLADREYMEPLGYPALGRTVRAGIRTRF